MTDRIGMFGPLQQTVIGAVDEVVNIPPFINSLPRLNVPDMWYSSIIQSGIDKIEIPIFSEPEYQRLFGNISPTVGSVARRTRVVAVEDLKFFFYVITNAFEDYFPADAYEKADAEHYAEFDLFLIELLVAARRKRNIISVRQMPDTKFVESALPPDLCGLIQSLFSSFQSHSVSVPTANTLVDAKNIKFFDEIMICRAYEKYKKAHVQLEESDTESDIAISSIGKATNALVGKYPSLLTMKESILNILPVTTKLIDTVFGRLPGAIAETSTKILGSWLRDRRQLIIYQYRDLQGRTVEKRIKDFAHILHKGSKE